MGKQIIHLDEIDSTNSYLLKMTNKKAVLPWLIVTTDFQTHGRGQRSNQWFSSRSKNLLCSILLKPTFLHPTDQFLINIIASLSMYDVLDEIIQSDRTKIKWPNDIYIDDYKVAGLLIQNSIQGSSIHQTILGMGINLNEESFPLELSRAISLKLLTHQFFDPQIVLKHLIRHIKKYYAYLKSGQIRYLQNNYTSKLYRLNELRNFEDHKGNSFKGIILGVNDLGQLKVGVNEEILHFSMKEIVFLMD